MADVENQNTQKEFDIIVEREKFKSKGNDYYRYFISGEIKGRTIRASLAPPDAGGYEVLDILFSLGAPVKLLVTPYEMTNDRGETITGNTYAARAVDPDDGEVYEMQVKPDRKSDKALLGFILR